jgi:hypothetical protein
LRMARLMMLVDAVHLGNPADATLGSRSSTRRRPGCSAPTT